MKSFRRAGIVETDVVEEDRFLEAREFLGVRLFLDLHFAIEIFEDALRGSQGLLEDIVDAGEALHRFVEHE
jgi:hypothetical protein